MADEYKFPHEAEKPEVDNTEDLKVEIVDDTPEQDRGRQPLPKNIVEDLDNDDLEEYSDKVKKRLSQMKKVWHDERREKEEAVRYAQRAFEENKQLKQRLGAGERVLVNEFTKSATNDITAAREKLKAAYETGDAERIAEAQEALTDAKLHMKEVEKFKPSLQEENNQVQQNYQTQQPAVTVDPKAETWRERNQWFGANKSMTAFALGLHDELVESGVDPRSDDYYRRVDSTMKKRFSDYFEGADNTEAEEKPAPRRASTVVAPATRSSAPRQVRLTASQVALAKKLGLTPEAYAREVMKLENGNG